MHSWYCKTCQLNIKVSNQTLKCSEITEVLKGAEVTLIIPDIPMKTQQQAKCTCKSMTGSLSTVVKLWN